MCAGAGRTVEVSELDYDKIGRILGGEVTEIAPTLFGQVPEVPTKMETDFGKYWTASGEIVEGSSEWAIGTNRVNREIAVGAWNAAIEAAAKEITDRNALFINRRCMSAAKRRVVALKMK